VVLIYWRDPTAPFELQVKARLPSLMKHTHAFLERSSMPSDYSTGDSLRVTPASTSASPVRVSPISPLLRTPAVNPTKHERPPTPESPPPSPALSHKRPSAQHDRTHEDDEHEVPRRRQDSYDFAGHRTCICMPEAKIPRPRNGMSVYIC